MLNAFLAILEAQIFKPFRGSMPADPHTLNFGARESAPRPPI